jgi:hypothetical protein
MIEFVIRVCNDCIPNCYEAVFREMPPRNRRSYAQVHWTPPVRLGPHHPERPALENLRKRWSSLQVDHVTHKELVYKMVVSDAWGSLLRELLQCVL